MISIAILDDCEHDRELLKVYNPSLFKNKKLNMRLVFMKTALIYLWI